MSTFYDYVKQVRASGKQYFTAKQALADLHISINALYLAIHRLKIKGEIVSPANSLYVIVPPEHQAMGCIPAEELVPILMQHWEVDYYACLQTAALYHEASHQKPQLFQVMASKRINSLAINKVRLEFIYKKSLVGLPIQSRAVKTGYLKVSSPELTVIDLLLYLKRSGGLNQVATILSEIVGLLDPKKLIMLIDSVKEKVCFQKLGYILDHIDTMAEDKKNAILEALQIELGEQKLFYTPLAKELATKGCLRNKKWKIIENTTVESDNDT